ncbi:ATP12 family chaperone protein [Cohaesibacter haloalkalitolerans]|uniref:ATP12 family chaperone protein n=1 Tax=Cohaesibacter haloalkalitolerans TaxID=1162980 RepID=UPI000E65E276|nr:ATP12 family protein [Cohaesibacter haloalkalitolerans]
MADKDTEKSAEVQTGAEGEPRETYGVLFGDFRPGQKDSSDNPMMRSKEATKRPLPKRFYKDVTVGEETDNDGNLLYCVLLDGRKVKSPAKRTVAVPNRALAEALVAEWAAQETEINPATMPLSRLVNSIRDGVEEARPAMIDEIVAYLNSDFLCYPATHPERLVQRQRDHWHPVLNRAEEALGGRFVQASGILAVEQSPVMGARLRALWGDLDIFQLGAVHSVMTLTGSALLAFAVWDGFLHADAAWNAAMVDEDWNIELWGEDEEATKRRAFRRAEYDAAVLVIRAFRD